MIGKLLSLVAIPAPIRAVGAFVGGILHRIPWQVWLGAALVGVTLLYGHIRYNAGQAAVWVKFDAYKAQVIAATQKAKDAAVRAEHVQAGAIATAVDTFKKENADALVKRDAVAAGVRSGALQLRDHWACPAGVPATPADSARAAEEAELRAKAAGDIIQIGAAADAEVEADQAVMQADRTQ